MSKSDRSQSVQAVEKAVKTVEKAAIKDIGEIEQAVLRTVSAGERVSKNVNELDEERLTVGQKLADRFAGVVGSWTFLLSFLGLMLVWVLINGIVLVNRTIDPYPFILLNLVLSGVAGMQAPVIMMSQNRQDAKDRLSAEHDYQVNLKAEIEIEHLHTKLDRLREVQWKELVEMQQKQIALLEKQIQMLESVGTRVKG